MVTAGGAWHPGGASTVETGRRTMSPVVTLGYHLKTGHKLSLQNRPTDFTQDTKMLYRAGRYSGKSFFDGRRPRAPRRGIAQGGFQRSALKSLLRGEARCLRRGGNHPRPGLPLGETGKGDQIPCCRRLICPGKTSTLCSRLSLRFGLFFPIGLPRRVALHPKLVHPSALARRRFESPAGPVCRLRRRFHL